MIRQVWTSGDATALAQVFLPEPRGRARAVLPIALAMIVHGAVALAIPGRRILPAADLPPTQIIELVPPPPPPAPEPPPLVKPPPAPEPPPAPAQLRTVQPRSQPPAPAQAAAVVTQKEDLAAPADFTDSMVVGDATTYAGGTTSATGTTVRKVEVAGNGAGRAGAPAAETSPGAGSPDRTRRARLAGDATWACDFPREADEAQIDHAVVTLRIAVDIQGAANSVTIVTDPGSGFGREARACAMLKRYEPALNRDGQPVAGTSLVNVRFDR